MSCVGRNDEPEGNRSSLEDYLAVPLFSVKSAAGLVLRTSFLHLCFCFTKVFDNAHRVILIKQRLVALIMVLRDRYKSG